LLEQLSHEQLINKYGILCEQVFNQQQLLAINQDPKHLGINQGAYKVNHSNSDKFYFLRSLEKSAPHCIKCVGEAARMMKDIEDWKKKNNEGS
jgi:hypothetical protein